MLLPGERVTRGLCAGLDGRLTIGQTYITQRHTHTHTEKLKPAVKQPLICAYYFKCFYVSLVAVIVALYAVNLARYGSTLNAVPCFTTVNRYVVTEDTQEEKPISCQTVQQGIQGVHYQHRN